MMEISKDLMNEVRKNLSVKRCFISGCSEKSIKAHSIQRNGVLSCIADLVSGQSEVYFLDDDFFYDQEKNVFKLKQTVNCELHRRGIGLASTFLGFCDDHDKLFSVIETVKFQKTPEQLFYHSYRAFAYFIHKKHEELNMLDQQYISQFVDAITTIIDIAPQLKNPNTKTQEGIKILEENISEIVEKYKELPVQFEDWRTRLNDIVQSKSKSYSDMEYRCISIDRIHPFACSSIIRFIPKEAEYIDGYTKPALFALTVFPEVDQNKTHIILGGFSTDNNLKILFTQLDKMNCDDRNKFLSDLILTWGFNCYISPRMINKMGNEKVEEIIKLRSEEHLYDDIGKIDTTFNFFDEEYAE